MAGIRQRDGIVPRLAYAGLRTAMLGPRVFGIRGSLRAARGAGRLFGRAGFNAKRVNRACERLSVAMPELDGEAHRELVYKSYEHLAMLAVEVATLGDMIRPDRWYEHVEIGSMEPSLRALLQRRPVILITGHCGNWEMLGATLGVVGYPVHALYRPLDLKPIDNWLRRTRAACGVDLIDKFGAAEVLPGLLTDREPVAFVADQNAGDRGVFVPYFGRLASAYKTIALLALQHDAVIICGSSRRLAAGESKRFPRYRLEIEDHFGPETYREQPDPAYYITARYRRAIESMVRKSPEQYLWMHRAWKSRPLHERNGKGFPDRLRERLDALPWMTSGNVEAIVDRSDRDARWLAEAGKTRLP